MLFELLDIPRVPCARVSILLFPFLLLLLDVFGSAFATFTFLFTLFCLIFFRAPFFPNIFFIFLHIPYLPFACTAYLLHQIAMCVYVGFFFLSFILTSILRAFSRIFCMLLSCRLLLRIIAQLPSIYILCLRVVSNVSFFSDLLLTRKCTPAETTKTKFLRNFKCLAEETNEC